MLSKGWDGRPELGIYGVEMGMECEAVDRVGEGSEVTWPIRSGVDTYNIDCS